MPRLSMIEGVGSVTTGFFMAEFARADARRFGQRSISERSTPPTESFVELGAGIGSGDLGIRTTMAAGLGRSIHGRSSIGCRKSSRLRSSSWSKGKEM